MRYVREVDLRDQFWLKYGYRKSIVRFQFETDLGGRPVDLVTIERVKDTKGDKYHFELVSFEFKLDDIEKALSQAKDNIAYSHKSYIVIPEHKWKTVSEKYMCQLEKYTSIGVFIQKYEGGYEIMRKATFNSKARISDGLIKLCLDEFE